MSWGELIDEALRFSVERHRGTFRDGEYAVPYACHPVEVMLILRRLADVTDEDVLAAALLHDTVEDTDTTLSEISSVFGERVADLVGQVTRDEPSEDQTKGMDKDEIWELRNSMMMEEIREMSEDAKRIKLADRLNNIREAKKVKSGKKLKRYVRQTREILEEIEREVCPVLWDAVQSEV